MGQDYSTLGCGTCVIRTSSKLTATQQKELTKKIVESLTQL